MSNGKYNNPLTATINGILDSFRKKEPIGKLKDTDRMEGKTCLVTGANSGLGFAIATQLAQRGGRIVMACRSGIPEKGEEVKQLSGSKQVEMLPIDLTDLDSIHAFVKTLKDRGETIDIAIFNAAVVPSGSVKTASGFDQMFLVNYLSKFLLVNELISAGVIARGENRIPRIIFVSSESHRTDQAIDIDKMGVFEPYSMGKVVALYGYYKLLMNTYAKELSRRLNHEKLETAVHALCPGPVNSNIARSAPGWAQPILKVVFAMFFSSPTKAAEPVVYLACAPELENQTDLYLHQMQKKEMDVKALDPTTGAQLWAKSEALLGQKFSSLL